MTTRRKAEDEPTDSQAEQVEETPTEETEVEDNAAAAPQVESDVAPQGLVHGPEGDDVQPLVEGAPVSAAARHNVRYGTA